MSGKRLSGGFPGVAVLACLGLTPPPPTAAQPGTTACQSRSNGPCRSPEPFGFLPSPPYPSGIVVANFGLLLPAPSGGTWQYVCDDRYGLAPAHQIWRAPAGRLFAAGRSGLQASDDEGCSWTPAGGDLAGPLVADLAIERHSPGRVWALSAGSPVLFQSSDGGRTFRAQRTFPESYREPRLLAAPSRAGQLYLAAATAGATTVLELSADGGDTWDSREITAGLAPPPRNPLVLVAIGPDDPAALYFSIVDQAGDEIWHSPDGGRSLTRILRLHTSEAFAGLAFGPTGGTVFVAGSASIVIDGRPPAHLYRSDDGGRSWAEPIPSGVQGPFYRCLGHDGGRLLACGVGESAGDRFLIGASTDQGRSFTPVVRLADVAGPRACARDQCFATEAWLCEIYGRCAGATPADAGATDAGPARSDAGSGAGAGCSCLLAASPAAPGAAAIALLPTFLLARRRRRLRSSPGRPPGR